MRKDQIHFINIKHVHKGMSQHLMLKPQFYEKDMCSSPNQISFYSFSFLLRIYRPEVNPHLSLCITMNRNACKES